MDFPLSQPNESAGYIMEISPDSIITHLTAVSLVLPNLFLNSTGQVEGVRGICICLQFSCKQGVPYKKPQKTAVKPNKEYKILIVDDSITTRELLKNILVHWGYSFEMVKNPREAFEILYKDEFDLILSDMEMPEMDGGMFVKELKSHQRLKDIPVIIISSYDTELMAKNMPDVDAFIQKSNFNQDYLLDVIEKLLKYD